MSNLIVERPCIAISPDGERIETCIGLEKPEQLDVYRWDCKLNFGKLDFEERRAFGIDGWQALQLGMEMMHVELDFKSLTGWKFLWFEGTSDNLEELWPYTHKSSSNVSVQ